MTISKLALLDTNILVYAADTSSPFHMPAKSLRDKGFNGEVALCICPQTLTEFYAVITDSKRVAHPRKPKEAVTEIKNYLMSDRILKVYPKDNLMERMLVLLDKYKVTRQAVFDLQLVSTMLSNGIKRIYTYNKEHFQKFEEVEVVSPDPGQ